MSDVQKQMRPFLKHAESGYYEFQTEVMFDVFMRGWTYKRWEVALAPGDEAGAPWRVIGSWVDSNEAGDYVELGETYEPSYFDSLESALLSITLEVESYI